MAVVPEPFGAENVVTVHAGVLEMAVHVLGNSRHISRKEEAVDAIANMCKAVPAISNVDFTYTPRADLPGLPRITWAPSLEGADVTTTSEAPTSSPTSAPSSWTFDISPECPPSPSRPIIQRALDEVASSDPDFHYEIEMPPDPKHKVFRVVMEPFDLPRDEYILDSVLRQYRTVTGGEPQGLGAVLPYSYTGDDTCHLWQAGVPCLLFGPGGGSESDIIPDEYIRINRHGAGSQSPNPHRPRRLLPPSITPPLLRCPRARRHPSPSQFPSPLRGEG